MDEQRLRLAIQRILALPVGDRAAAIASEAAGDSQLLAALERALRDATVLGPDSASRSAATGPAGPESLVPGEEIADGSLRYRLVKRIPGGGLGEVWIAEQTAPVRRRVAMKFIRDDRITKATLERFENERRLLASFDHPNIARYYHDGHYGDRPWFAMEYVEGDTIDVYCRRNGLSVSERIRLVQQVARAVQYAHDREVVHRDLKPQNILVSTEGVPKLLDFGIAKILKSNYEGPRGITSDFEPRTDEYASPEQLENRSSTTRSDVYALGVLLYELLTDQLPYHVRTRVREAILELKRRDPPPPMSEALDQVEDDEDPAGAASGAASDGASSTPSSRTSEASGDRRRGSRTGRRRQPSRRLTAIAQSRGTRPDRLIRQLRGNLDNIVLKAMRIEPLRRYDSPAALAADLDNHLQGLPVAALPESRAARLSRLLVRNRWWVVGSLAALAASAAALLSIAVVESERARVERQRVIFRSGFGSAVDLLSSDASKSADAGDIRRLQETLSRMERDYTAISEAGTADAATVNDWVETGEIRRRLSVLADSPANRAFNEGNPQRAAEWAERAQSAVQSAIALATELGEALPWKGLQLSARLERDRGDLAQHRQRDLQAAEASYRAAASMFDAALAAQPANSPDRQSLRRERLTVATKLADLAQQMGRLEGLVAEREEIVGGYRELLKSDPTDLARIDLSIGLFRLGESMEVAGGAPTQASHQCFEDAVEVLRPALGASAGIAVRRAAMEAMMYLADRLIVRAMADDASEDQRAIDRRRVGELLGEAANEGVTLAVLAPDDARVRQDLLRLHQLLLPGVDRDWALPVLETIRVVRIEPDRWLLREAKRLPTKTADALATPASRALQIAYGNRLAHEWGGSLGQVPPAISPDHATVRQVMRESLEIARAVPASPDTDLALLVEAMCCLAIAADPRVSALLWPGEEDRARAVQDSLTLARVMRDRVAARKRELVGAIVVAAWFADERLKAVDPEPVPPGQ
jgi:serine/threonine protein kinase